MNIKPLLEEIASAMKTYGGVAYIYSPPFSKSDLETLKRYDDFRFIADVDNKKIYCFDPYLSTHEDVDKHLHLNAYNSRTIMRHIIYATGSFVNDKIKYLDSFHFDDIMDLKEYPIDDLIKYFSFFNKANLLPLEKYIDFNNLYSIVEANKKELKEYKKRHK